MRRANATRPYLQAVAANVSHRDQLHYTLEVGVPLERDRSEIGTIASFEVDKTRTVPLHCRLIPRIGILCIKKFWERGPGRGEMTVRPSSQVEGCSVFDASGETNAPLGPAYPGGCPLVLAYDANTRGSRRIRCVEMNRAVLSFWLIPPNMLYVRSYRECLKPVRATVEDGRTAIMHAFNCCQP